MMNRDQTRRLNELTRTRQMLDQTGTYIYAHPSRYNEIICYEMRQKRFERNSNLRYSR